MPGETINFNTATDPALENEQHIGELPPDPLPVQEQQSTIDQSILTPDATPEDLKRNLQLNVVDISDGVHKGAGDYAAMQNNFDSNQGGFLGKLKNQIWHGHIAKNHKILNYRTEARENIVKEQNLYANEAYTEDQKIAAHQKTADAVASRFGRGHVHYGETQRDLGATDSEKGLESGLNKLVVDFAEGRIDEDTLVAQKNSLLEGHGKFIQQKDRKQGLMFADNVLEVAINARAAKAHGVGIERIDESLSAKLGEARMGVRTDAHLSGAERLVDKMYNTKVGAWVNETTLNAIVATGFTAVSLGKSKAVAAATLLSGGALGGLMAAGREAYHIKQDRSTHAREVAQGSFGESLIRSGKRREALEKTRYKTVSAESLIAGIDFVGANAGTDPASLRLAIDKIAEARARVQKSDEEGIDLIHYSHKTNVDDEIAQIDNALAKARSAVEAAASGFDTAALEKAGLASTNVEAALSDATAANRQELGQQNEAQDKAFRILQAKRVVAMGVTGFFVGSAVGTAVQEGKALLDNALGDNQLQGLWDSRSPGTQRQTILAGIFKGENVPAPGTGPDLATHPVTLGENATVNVPDGYKLVNESGNWTVLDPENHAITAGVSVANGDPAQQALALKQQLELKGFTSTFNSEMVDATGTPTQESAPQSPKDYLASHKEDFTHVKRTWMDDNTSGVFEKHNERSLHITLDAKGNYVLDASNFTESGSFHGGKSVDPQQMIREGKLSAQLSMDKDTQNYGRMVTFGPDGKAVIDKDSFEGQMFTTQDGEPKFKGGFAEAVVDNGKGPDGRHNVDVLATVTGENNITSMTPDQHREITMSIAAHTAAIQEMPTEMAWAVPILKRGGLEYPEYQNPYPEPTPPGIQFIPDPTPRPGAGLERIPEAPIAIRDEPDVPGTELAIPEAPRAPGTDVDIFQPEGPRAITGGPNEEGELPQPPPIRATVIEQNGRPVGPDGRPIYDTPELEAAPGQNAGPGNSPAVADEIYDAEIVDDVDLRSPQPPREALDDVILDGEVVAGSEVDVPSNNYATPQLSAAPGTDVDLYTGPPNAVSGTDTIDGAPQYAELDSQRRELEPRRPLAIESTEGRPGTALELARAINEISPSAGRDLSNPINFLNAPLAVESIGSEEPRSVGRERSAVGSYLDRQRTDDPSMHASAERAANALPTMAGTNRVVVNLIGSEDADDISISESNSPDGFTELNRKLTGYVNQRDSQGERLSVGSYEINVAIPVINGVPKNNATAVVQQFIDEYQLQNNEKPPINIMPVEVDEDRVTEAYVRKAVADATLRRSLNRLDQESPLYIISQDVDDTNVDPQAVSKVINQFDSRPNASAVQFEFDKSPEYIVNNDMLLTQQLADRISRTLLKERAYDGAPSDGKGDVLDWNNKKEFAITDGWNAAVSVDAYARADGYDTKLEDAMRLAKHYGVGLDEEGNNLLFSAVINTRTDEFLAATGNVLETGALTSRLLVSLGMSRRDFTLDNEGFAIVKDWSGLRTKLDRYRTGRQETNRLARKSNAA